MVPLNEAFNVLACHQNLTNTENFEMDVGINSLWTVGKKALHKFDRCITYAL